MAFILPPRDVEVQVRFSGACWNLFSIWSQSSNVLSSFLGIQYSSEFFIGEAKYTVQLQSFSPAERTSNFFVGSRSEKN